MGRIVCLISYEVSKIFLKLRHYILHIEDKSEFLLAGRDYFYFIFDINRKSHVELKKNTQTNYLTPEDLLKGFQKYHVIIL